MKIDFSGILSEVENTSLGNIYRNTRDIKVGPFGKGEITFKLAAVALVFEGIYPSGRQILNRLGRTNRTEGRKVNLNGDECYWKNEVMALFKIKPYFGYTKRYYRASWEESVSGREFLFERAPNGSLRRIKYEN